MNTRYPSRQEVLRKLQPELDWIRFRSVYAEYAEPSTPVIHYREIVGEKSSATTGAQTSPVNGSNHELPKILEDHIRFMTDIQRNPFDGLKARYTRLEWGIEKGNRILGELKALGYVVVNEVKSAAPNGGRSRLVATLTEKGVRRLNSDQPPAP